ncbi:MAG: SusC/RagA family TonB-linked outer membrane protein [Rikenellaceae bacterium]
MIKKILLSLTTLLLLSASAFAQGRKASGVVVDEAGIPVLGASVIVVGTNLGVMTGLDGDFIITNIPKDANELEISYIGYTTVIVAVSDKINVTLNPDAQAIESVVVTGMTKTDKRLFTGAADRLSADDVKLAGMPDISRGLEGRSAGVSVQNVSGTFGSAPKIRVRGATSIFGSSKPLWVVDGVIMEDVLDVDADALASGDAATLISSAIAGLNAEDIESFDVLKDGSATSIYGARAMAGVIVITTKKGRAGESRINYSGEFTYRDIPSYDDYNIMNSQEQMSVYQELYTKGWLNNATLSNASNSGVYGKMWELVNNGSLANTEAARNAYLRNTAEYINTDWFDELFKRSIMQTHSVSMTSGTEKAQYYASLSAMFDPGWTLASEVERYTANLNSTYKIYDKLSLGMISSASYRKQKAPGTLSSTTDVVSGEVKRDFDINPYSYALNSSRALDINETYTSNYAPFNILDELDNNYIDLSTADMKFQAELKYNPIEGLDISALGAVKYSAATQEHNITDYSNQAMAYRAMGTTMIQDGNSFLYTDPDDAYAVPITVLPQGGIYKRTDNSMFSYDFRLSGSYSTTINDNHIVNAYAGLEINSSERHETWFRGWGLQYSMGMIPYYAYEVFKKGQESNTAYYGLTDYTSRNVASFANLAYSWQGKYALNGTIRYEGTNRMGESRQARWLPTWNISGAWNVDQEEWFQNQTVMDALQLKASYSLTADRGPSWVTNSTAVITSYNPWRPSTGDTESGLTLYDLENSELTYEKKNEFNVGLSSSLFGGRFNVGADWYTRDNYDLIGTVTTQGIGGIITKYGNSAAMKSSGWELSLSSTNIKTRDFKWTTDFIYAKSVSEITKLESSKRAIDMVTASGFGAVGYPVRSIFSYDFQGLNSEGLPTFINEAGELTVSDLNFQERENLDHLVYSGSADPTDYGSLGNTFSYKAFKLNFFITYSFGNVVRLDPVFSAQYSDLSASPREFADRWITAGDEATTNIPVIASARQYAEYGYTLAYAYNAYNYSTARIADGGFVRMKEISLSYDFPKELIQKLDFNSFSLKLQMTNPFLIYSDKALNGQDPEFSNSGGVAVPVAQQVTLSVRIGL